VTRLSLTATKDPAGEERGEEADGDEAQDGKASPGILAPTLGLDENHHLTAVVMMVVVLKLSVEVLVLLHCDCRIDEVIELERVTGVRKD